MSEGVFYEMITLPTPFAVGPVNVYLLKVEPLTLIDSGPATVEAEELLAAAFARAGFKLADLRAIIVTHAHPDHSGLAMRLRELSGAKVYAHEAEREKLMGGLEALNEGRLRVLREAGVPAAVLGEFTAALADSRKYLPRLDEVVGIKDGHVFRFDGLSLMALHMTGHSSGQICLYEPRGGVFFSGDQLLGEITPNPMLEPSDEHAMGRRQSLTEYLESLRTLRELEISLVLPGHGVPIRDHVRAIDDVFKHHAARMELVYDLLGDEGQTVYDLVGKMFPGLRGFDIFLGVSEVVAHLDVLLAEGRVECECRADDGATDDGVVLYRRGAGRRAR